MFVSDARAAAELFGLYFEAASEGERLVVAHLDVGRRLIEVIVIPSEGPTHVELPVRRILEDALRLGAAGVVVAHNHLSGDAQPTWQDVEATRELAETAARLGIRVHDHIIYAGAESSSLRALGLL